MGNRQAAIEFYNQAVVALNDKANPVNGQSAYQLFSSACLVDPTYGQAFFQHGNNNHDLKREHAALANWRRALECKNTDEEKSKILVNIAWVLHCLGNSHEAFEHCQQALALNPQSSIAYVNLSVISGILDAGEWAITYARKAFALDPADMHTEFALAFALLFEHQMAEGLKHFEVRFPHRLHHYLNYPYPKWNGELGKTVFLSADQGLGDTLRYARFVAAACQRAKYVHAMVQPELHQALRYALAGIKNLNLIPMPCPFPPADAWTTFVSLPHALGLTDDEILSARQVTLPVFDLPLNWRVPDRKFHIGIAWAGSALNDIDKHRNIPVTQFLELYRVPGIQLYGLQIDARSKDAEDAGTAGLIYNLKPYVTDVCDTVALLQHLDLVITCDSALGHIAAAAGKEVWIPYSYLGRDYQLGNTGASPMWYPKTRCFRQSADRIGDWSGPFEEIIRGLQGRVR